MSDSIDQRSVDSTPPTDPTPVVEPPQPPARRGWVLPVAVVASLLVGALAATAVIVFTGWYEPDHRFTVTVYLEDEATAEQKAALQSALAGLESAESVAYESREQAWQQVQDGLKDRPDLAQSIKVDEMPSSFSADFYEPWFDCEIVTPLVDMAGVDNISVTQRPVGDRPGMSVACGNLL